MTKEPITEHRCSPAALLQCGDVGIDTAAAVELVAGEVSVVGGGDPIVGQRVHHVLDVHLRLGQWGDHLSPVVEHQKVSETLLQSQ